MVMSRIRGRIKTEKILKQLIESRLKKLELLAKRSRTRTQRMNAKNLGYENMEERSIRKILF